MHPANNVLYGLQRFCKEVLVAKQVQNDYVLAIAGVQIIDKEFHLCIVSEWMENGNMHTFLEDNLVPDCAQLVSLRPHPLHQIPDSLGIAAQGDKGTQLLTLHWSGSRGSEERKHSIFPSVFCLIEIET